MGFFDFLSDVLSKTMDYAVKETERIQKEQDRAEAKIAELFRIIESVKAALNVK